MSVIQLSDYDVEEPFYEGPHFVTYRARCISNQKKVILKTVPGDYPDLKLVASLEYEYHLLQKLHFPGVIKVYKLIKESNREILVLEDVTGITLKEWMANKPIKLKDFYKISLQLAKIVGFLHHHHIIHKDINPNNIVINPANLDTTLMEFNISTELSFEPQEILDTISIEGNLAYISPEQTGRFNHVLDARSDFYSLGVTFFEMLTGRLPFESDDHLELVYSHLAETPPLPHNYNSHIPASLSSIILKLLAKMPEERYQTAEGLEADLIECEKQEQKKITTRFISGLHDVNDQLLLSQRLYGREKEIKQLLSVFDEVSQGKTKLFLVSGYAGIGKTSLVKEIYKPITRQHGYFISGKYDQLQRATPYSALIEAFQGLVRQLLAEPKEKLSKIKEKLLDALGHNGRVIEQVLPNISHIIGPQPPLAQLSPVEEQNRFILTFQNLIRALSESEHPLVVFLDDLQWIDNGSLQLIKLLLTDEALEYFLLIGSYRSNEITADHPLMHTLEQLQKSGIQFDNLLLPPLKKDDINHLLADSLHTEMTRVSDLSQLLLQKTEGNPFFINEFLKKIHQDKLIFFSHVSKIWEWNIQKIEQQAITTNVIELLSNRISQLPAQTQETLQLASCVGHVFDLHTLSIIAEESILKLSKQLWLAIQAGLISPLEEGLKIRLLLEDIRLLDSLDLKKIRFQFIHDRVQQAAYQFIQNQDRESIHLKIGRLLLKEKPLEEKDDRLFKILDHFNQSIQLIEMEEEKLTLAKYNLWAGEKAKSSMAYSAAINYLEAGLKLLTPLKWNLNYDLIFSLQKELATCLYLSGEFEKVQIVLNELLSKTKSKASKFQLYTLNCEMLATLKKHNEALELGVKALRLINIHLPIHTKTWHALAAILKIKFKTSWQNVENIELSPLEDPVYLEATKLIGQLCNSAFFVNQNLLVLLTCALVNISFDYGRWDSTSTFFLSYAFIIMHSLGWYKECLSFAALSKKIRSHYLTSQFDGRDHVLLGTCIEPWHKSLRECAEILEEGQPLAYESGDLMYATHSYTSLIMTVFMEGKSLPLLKNIIKKALIFIERIKMSATKNIVLTWDYVTDCLLGNKKFTHEQLQFYEQENLTDDNNTQINAFYSLSVKINYLLGHFTQAVAAGVKHHEYEKYGLATVSNMEGLFYYALALIANTHPGKDQKNIAKPLKKIHQDFKRWAKWCPMNYKHYLCLLDAETAYLQNNMLLAMERYDEAIKLANDQESFEIAGIANECAARFYQFINKPVSAKGYILNAHYAYQRWGALAKCMMLEETYPDLFRQIKVGSSTQHHLTEIGVKEHSGNLDLLSILKAVQLISNEIDSTRLLKQLIRTLLKNAGAQKGMLIVKKNEKWRVEAAIKHGNEVLLPKLSIEKSENIPMSVFNYVERSAEILLLNDAKESEFKNDPYIIQHQPKSILCMPIMQHHESLAIIYLENNAINGAFTEKHLAALKLLAGQVAISLENAQLYAAGKLFVPFEFLTQLDKRNLTEVNLGDHIQKQLSILFCDIQGFTRISEELSAAGTFKFINFFLGLMEPIIAKHGGFIDKYIGDAIMALFDQKADAAVKAAIAMQKCLRRENKKRIENHMKPINIGIGINTGDLMLGMIGSKHHLENSVIGDAVNIASHIEHLTRLYGVDLLISSHTKICLAHPENFQLRLIDTVNLKGKLEVIEIWEVCNSYSLKKRQLLKETFKNFNKALTAYRNEQFSEAIQWFKACLEVNPHDNVSKMYQKKCRRILAKKRP